MARRFSLFFREGVEVRAAEHDRAVGLASPHTRLLAGGGGDGDHTRPLQRGCWGNVALSLPMGPPFRIMPCILYWQMR